MLYYSTNILKLQYDSLDILSCFFYGSFYDNNVSIFSEPWNESYHDDPLFLFNFWIIYMYIFHLAKGQENFNSRSKMAHLPLSHIMNFSTVVYMYLLHTILPSSL